MLFWFHNGCCNFDFRQCMYIHAGIAKRVCDFNGTWLVPDVLECQKNSFASVLNQVNSILFVSHT